MDSIWCKILLVCFVLKTATSERDPNVCDVVTESYGLIPPPLPTNFEMKGEQAEFLSKSLIWNEMYYDNTYLRGKYMFIENGIEHHILFDYNVSQVIYYDILHPGSSVKRDPLSSVCVTEDIETSKYNYIFGYKYGNLETKHSRMFNAYEVLRYGGPYQYMYNGSTNLESRGMKANNFKGCVYDSSAKFTAAINYYFSDQVTVPAGGTLESIVDGVENLALLSVPLGNLFEGTRENPAGDAINFKMSHSISWFKGDPEFDNEKFRIPLGLYCENYRGWKAMPKFPLAFSARLETTAFTQDMIGKMQTAEMTLSSQLWYYNEKGLARRDYTPLPESDGDIFGKFQNYAPVKTVYDFTTGVLYIINKPSGRCYERIINNGDFFETSKVETLIEMGSPEEIFLMHQDTMEYKGQHYSRDIQCDVWSGKYFSKKFNKTIYKETYFSTNGWHEDAEEKVEYGVPVSHTIITNDMKGEFSQSFKENHFFKFKAYAPPLAMFDVTPCIETLEHEYYLIIPDVNKDDEEVLYRYRYQLQEAVQYYLAEISQVVTPLRVQKVELVKTPNHNLITFALVGKPKVKTATPYALKGPSIKEAASFIKKNIDDGNFILKFHPPRTSEIKLILASPGSFYRFPPDGRLSFADVQIEAPKRHASNDQMMLKLWYDANVQPRYNADESKTEEKKGMSKGGLAGLSIAMLLIGIAIGIAVMYLYLRKFSAESLQDSYAMHNK